MIIHVMNGYDFRLKSTKKMELMDAIRWAFSEHYKSTINDNVSKSINIRELFRKFLKKL